MMQMDLGESLLSRVWTSNLPEYSETNVIKLLNKKTNWIKKKGKTKFGESLSQLQNQFSMAQDWDDKATSTGTMLDQPLHFPSKNESRRPSTCLPIGSQQSEITQNRFSLASPNTTRFVRGRAPCPASRYGVTRSATWCARIWTGTWLRLWGRMGPPGRAWKWTGLCCRCLREGAPTPSRWSQTCRRRRNVRQISGCGSLNISATVTVRKQRNTLHGSHLYSSYWQDENCR